MRAFTTPLECGLRVGTAPARCAALRDVSDV